MRNGAHQGRRGSADGVSEGHQNSTAGRSPATPDPLAEEIEIAKFWRNRRGEAVIVKLRRFEGKALVDCRVHFTDKEGKFQPSHKGLTLLLGKLPELSKAITKAEQKARELGLIQDDE